MAHAFDAEYSRTGMVSRYERSSTGWCTFVWSFGDKPGKFYVRNVIVVSLNEGGHDWRGWRRSRIDQSHARFEVARQAQSPCAVLIQPNSPFSPSHLPSLNLPPAITRFLTWNFKGFPCLTSHYALSPCACAPNLAILMDLLVIEGGILSHLILKIFPPAMHKLHHAAR